VGGIRKWREARKRRLTHTLQAKLSEGARDERGAVAIIFAFAVIVLVPLVLGLFDVYTASEQRARLQDALDAAALYAARSDSVDGGEIDTLGNRALMANLKLLRGATLISSHFGLTENNTKITATATVQPMALAPAFWAHPPITVGTDVVRNSKNLEVALVLDLTGSMKGSKVGDLKDAAKELIGLVVKDTAGQTPYYSRVALVPWAAAVNVGSDATAAQARGAVNGIKPVTAIADWKTATVANVSGVTKANQAVVTTAANHGLTDGQGVMLTGVTGMTEINGVPYKVANATPTTFKLKKADGTYLNSSSFGTYTTSSTDKVTKCARTDCSLRFTVTGHGYSAGWYVWMAGMAPTNGFGSFINKKQLVVSNVADANNFDVVVGATTAAYTSGGTSMCLEYGCMYIRFVNSLNAVRIYKASNCVTERTGSNIDTDVAPSTKTLGFYYPAVDYSTPTDPVSYSPNYDNPCLTNAVTPLSDSKSDLEAKINAMAISNVTQGTTGGQVGTAWGWYMLSPNFSYMFPASGHTYAPASYAETDTLKVVVLMTDGALNTAYCKGVVSDDSTPQYPSMRTDHINCNATNGDTFTQAKNLCDKMQAAKVVIYTVGFDIGGDTTAQDLMDHCATDPSHKFLPNSGTELKDAFRAIGADINNLRLSK
jgi:Flp pilus assembly protein TadG